MATFRILQQSFDIHVTPLERIVYDVNNKDNLKVEFDDSQEVRRCIVFHGVVGLSLTSEDCVDYAKIEVEGNFPRRLLEVVPARWTSFVSSSFSKETQIRPYEIRHFMLPFQENILEVFAADYEMTDL